MRATSYELPGARKSAVRMIHGIAALTPGAERTASRVAVVKGDLECRQLRTIVICGLRSASSLTIRAYDPLKIASTTISENTPSATPLTVISEIADTIGLWRPGSMYRRAMKSSNRKS